MICAVLKMDGMKAGGRGKTDRGDACPTTMDRPDRRSGPTRFLVSMSAHSRSGGFPGVKGPP
jgi:hypothetical protein